MVWGGGADVSVDLDQVGQASAIDDVRDLDLTVTGANAAGLLLGYNLALTGSVKVTLDADSAGASGDIYLKGGTSIDITRTATAGGVATFGRVDIEGAANTTSVKVKTTAPGAAVFDTVQITDRSHLPGVATSIRTVEVEGFDDFIFRGQDLETLKLANGSGRIELVPSATASVVTDLGLALDGVHATFADDGDRYDTVNITTTGAASTFDAMRFGALRTLTLDGDARLTVTDASGLTALQRVEITGDASLTADFSNATSLAEIDASAGAGDHVLTIDGRYTAYRGGAGAETLTIGPTQFAQTVVQTIEMGDGDDLMILGDMDLGVGASIDGGAGTDTLRVGSYNAEYRASDIATYTSGFERLEISPVGVMRINLDVLGFRHVAMIDSHPIQVEIAGMRSDDTLELTSSGDNYFLAGAALSGPDDQLNLILRDDAGAGLDFGVVNTAGFEAVNIQLAGPGDTTGRLKLTDLYVMTIVLSGDAGVTLSLIHI